MKQLAQVSFLEVAESCQTQVYLTPEAVLALHPSTHPSSVEFMKLN